MTNKLNVIFDNSDLHIQENLDPRNLKIFFGFEDEIKVPCTNDWTELDGSAIDLDCSCVEQWEEIDGDQINLDLDCTPEGLDCYRWKYIPPGVSIDFTCYCAPPIDQNNDFVIDCEENIKPTDLGRITFHAGERVTFEIHGLEIYTASQGEEVKFDLDVNRTVINPNVLTIGETLDKFDLTRDREFSATIKTGETLAPGVTFYPILNLDPTNIFGGDRADVIVSTISSLAPKTIEIGERIDVTLYESIIPTLKPNMLYTGEWMKPTLVTTTGFSASYTTGENISVEVEFAQYGGFPFDAAAGEEVTFSLYKPRLFYPDNILIGENVAVDIQTRPYEKFSAKYNIGEFVNFKLYADIQLGVFKTSDGQVLKVSSLASLDNYKAYGGEQIAVDLAVTPTFPTNLETGESVTFDLKRGEPQYLSFSASAGESFYADVKLLQSFTFRVHIEQGQNVYMNDWTHEPFHIDLDDRQCCNQIIGDLLRVEMDDAPYNWTRYDATFATCEIVSFELSTRRAMEFSVKNGEHMEFNNELNTMSFYCVEGQYAYVPSLRTITTVDLDDGNNEPENPVIDIDRPDIGGEIKYIGMSTGESMGARMGASYALNGSVSYGGDVMTVNVTFNPPFAFQTWGGESIRAVLNTNIQTSAKFSSGEVMRMSMYEPPFIAYGGEMMSCSLDTKSDYYAEFVTEGCLNNDYQDIDPESGQPIPNPNNGTTIEGDMFSKYIEGRCF